MTRLHLLADDLTGALDSGACCVLLAGPIAIVWHGADLPQNAAIDSGTRGLSDAEAQAAIARFAPLLARPRIWTYLDFEMRGMPCDSG